ncbi:hypothetical protein [Leptothermofonsia sp. ETS-13]|uniref:hypothetical protein n=1 Tax=Leptothermofonsia sp. ETS-13 TaxID=3035696 RepID=UPI003BA2DA2F
MLEISRHHSDELSVLQDSQVRTNEAIRDICAAIERMDQLFDYLVRRDQGQQK